jgi:hypothetical protein
MKATLSIQKNGEPYGYKRQVRVNAIAELKSVKGGRTYFSLTGEVLAPNGRMIAGGQVDELEEFTVFDIVRTVHLADENGVPMHAESNAKFWAGMASNNDKINLPNLASLLQVNEDTALEIANELRAGKSFADVALDFRLPQLWAAHADNARWAIEKVGTK